MAEVELKLLRARARKIDVLVRCLPEEGEYAPIHYFGLDDEEAEELELRYPSGWRPVPYSKKFVTRLGKGSSQALDESCRSTLRAMDGECLDGLALIALASAFMTLDLRCRVEIPEGAPEIWRKEPAETWIEAEYSMTPDNGECVATDTTRVVEPEELANRPAENWLARCWE